MQHFGFLSLVLKLWHLHVLALHTYQQPDSLELTSRSCSYADSELLKIYKAVHPMKG